MSRLFAPLWPGVQVSQAKPWKLVSTVFSDTSGNVLPVKRTEPAKAGIVFETAAHKNKAVIAITQY